MQAERGGGPWDIHLDRRAECRNHFLAILRGVSELLRRRLGESRNLSSHAHRVDLRAVEKNSALSLNECLQDQLRLHFGGVETKMPRDTSVFAAETPCEF